MITRYRVWSHVLLTLALQATLSNAAEFEQHEAHEHGKVALNVAVEGNKLTIELDAPAINVVGFEHAPSSDAERAAVANAQKQFQSGQRLFGVPPEAQCHLERVDVHSEAHRNHMDYEGTFTYACEAPGKLTWFEPWLLDKLLNVTALRINVISPSGQRSETVQSARTRVSLL
jgi:Protein of unknown function (DUF2796)